MRNYLKIIKIPFFQDEKIFSTEIHYPFSPHHQKAIQNIFKLSWPSSEEIHSTLISLPMLLIHTEENILKICKLINEIK